MSDQWLSIVEYARYYNLSDMTVRRRIKTGKLRAVLKDGKYFIPLKHESFHAGATSDEPTEASAQAWEYTSADELDATFALQSPPASVRFAPQGERREARPAPASAHAYQRRPAVVGAHIEAPHHDKPPRGSHERDVLVRPPQRSPRSQAGASHQQQHGNGTGQTTGQPLPHGLSEALNQQNSIMLESKALLSFCEKVIARLNESERRLEGDFQNKLTALEAQTKSLEAQLSVKEIKVAELQQQVEDLQLLVQIIEKQRPR